MVMVLSVHDRGASVRKVVLRGFLEAVGSPLGPSTHPFKCDLVAHSELWRVNLDERRADDLDKTRVAAWQLS
jgi:hypothetical protein